MTKPLTAPQKAAGKLLREVKRAGFEQVHVRIALDGSIEIVAGPVTEGAVGLSGGVNPLDEKVFGHAPQTPPAR